MNIPSSVTGKATSSEWQEIGSLGISSMYSKSSFNIVDSFLKTVTLSEMTYNKTNSPIGWLT